MTVNELENANITLLIHEQLDDIEAEHDVDILFAVESGSRAWGFASPDSDYDVRFVYRRPAREYVRLTAPRDVVEVPIAGDLDINGWDIVKALVQFRKSNPTLLEWLHSPIVYRSNGDLMVCLQTLAREHFSPRRMTYHYVSMAKQNYRLSIENKEEVSLKKYLYVLRPLACIAWLEQQNSPPPTSIHETLAGIVMPKDVRLRLDGLMERKKSIGELGSEAHDATLDAFIDAELERAGSIVGALPDIDIPAALLDKILWAELGL